MSKKDITTKKQAPTNNGEPMMLGDLMIHYANTSNEPFAQLLRKCMACQGCTANATPAPTPLEQWVDGQDVMQKLNISQRTLQNLRSCGALPYSVFGGRCFYKRADIERLLENGYRIDSHTTTYVEKGGWRDDD